MSDKTLESLRIISERALVTTRAFATAAGTLYKSALTRLRILREKGLIRRVELRQGQSSRKGGVGRFATYGHKLTAKGSKMLAYAEAAREKRL